jgi:hypothetical protein
VDAYNSKAWILATSSDTAFRNGAAAIELAQKSVKIEAGVDSLDTLAAAQSAAGSSGKTRLLVGAYDSRKDADKLAARLKAKGFTPGYWNDRCFLGKQ